MKSIVHFFIICLLTILTQIGGLIWVLNFAIYKFRKIKIRPWKKVASFFILYLLSTFFIVPKIAEIGGRTALPISKSGNLIPHAFITPLLNRHYVKPTLKRELHDVAKQVNSLNQNLKVSYLDANFPFLDGFPLLPHLSHNDGKKIDLSFYYLLNSKEGNFKPSNSGYGIFEDANSKESNQSEICKSRGHWQYDFSKYLTLGRRNDLKFDLNSTKNLIQNILEQSNTEKIFIEPHLKNRMNLRSKKIRFQGCHSVRHDDHIHYQIK